VNVLANIVTKLAWLVLAAVAVIVTVCLLIGIWPQPEDDILEFLPPQDQDVQVFRRISATFGGLEVA